MDVIALISAADQGQLSHKKAEKVQLATWTYTVTDRMWTNMIGGNKIWTKLTNDKEGLSTQFVNIAKEHASRER